MQRDFTLDVMELEWVIKLEGLQAQLQVCVALPQQIPPPVTLTQIEPNWRQQEWLNLQAAQDTDGC